MFALGDGIKNCTKNDATSECAPLKHIFLKLSQKLFNDYGISFETIFIETNLLGTSLTVFPFFFHCVSGIDILGFRISHLLEFDFW